MAKGSPAARSARFKSEEIQRFAFLAGLADFAGAFKAGVPFLRAAQRAFMDAARRARPSAVNPPFFVSTLAAFGAAGAGVAAAFPSLIFAHRSFCAATMRARASGDMVRFFFAGLAAAVVFTGAVAVTCPAPPRTTFNSASKLAICSVIRMAR